MSKQKLSKFNYETFFEDSRTLFVASKQRFTLEQATELAEFYFGSKTGVKLHREGYVRHRAGINDEGDACVGWWLEDEQGPKSCPVWIFEECFAPDLPPLKNKFNEPGRYVEDDS